MAGILDSTKINTTQDNNSRFFWGINARFFSQNYISAQTVYLVPSTQIGPYSYTIPEDLKDKVFDKPLAEDFYIQGTYCSYELFPKNISYYIGQPLLAVIESSPEKAKKAAEQIHIEYQNTKQQTAPPKDFQENILLSKTEKTASLDEIFNNKENHIFDFYYETPVHRNLPNCSYGAYAFIDENKRINVYTVTDWPTHVHRHVAACLGRDPDTVIIHPLVQGQISNDLLIEPTLWACYTAAAAEITGKPCKLLFPPCDAEKLAGSPQNKIHLQIALDSEKNILGCQADIKIFSGYKGYFMDEYLAQIYDLFTQMYHFSEYGIHIQIIETQKNPAGPYLTSCRAGLQCILETAVNHISRFCGRAPDELRLSLLQAKDKYTRDIMEELFSRVLENVDFPRKNLAYHLEAEQTTAHFFDENTLLSLPMRGIALSCASAPNGLLTPEYQKILISADWPAENEKLIIKIPALPHSLHFISHWKHILSQELGTDTDNIHIITENTADTAPYTLGSSVSIADPLILKLAENLKKKLKSKKFPIKEKLSNNDRANPPSKAQSMITCVVEIMIDPITFQIKIVHLDFALYCGRIHNETALQSYFSDALMQTLQWIFHRDEGSQSLWRADFSLWPGFNLNIVRHPHIEEEALEALPIAGLVESALPAAYLTAVSRALNTDVSSLPIFPETIFQLLKPKEETEA